MCTVNPLANLIVVDVYKSAGKQYTVVARNNWLIHPQFLCLFYASSRDSVLSLKLA